MKLSLTLIIGSFKSFVLKTEQDSEFISLYNFDPSGLPPAAISLPQTFFQ